MYMRYINENLSKRSYIIKEKYCRRFIYSEKRKYWWEYTRINIVLLHDRKHYATVSLISLFFCIFFIIHLWDLNANAVNTIHVSQNVPIHYFAMNLAVIQHSYPNTFLMISCMHFFLFFCLFFHFLQFLFVFFLFLLYIYLSTNLRLF